MSLIDRQFMQRALQLAERGRGFVEPNPMVGCVIVAGEKIVGEGWHQKFGGPHAEVEALAVAGGDARDAVMYVTLEPCCHFGKTPPCTDAIRAAGVRRVVVAAVDPFPQVAGGGLQQLAEAGVDVAAGTLAAESQWLNAPYWKLTTRGRPWVMVKWAMTLDGKVASRSGDSRWISNEASRAVVHQLRGRMDGILVGRSTVELDDPLLTARPPGPRQATRIVLDCHAALSVDSQLVRTASQVPVLVVTGDKVPAEKQRQLTAAGCELLAVAGGNWSERLPHLLDELGRRRLTNLLVEGGPTTWSGFWEAGLVDEVHAFVAPKLLGGATAPAPLVGSGAQTMAEASSLAGLVVEPMEGDVYISGRVTPRHANQTNPLPR